MALLKKNLIFFVLILVCLLVFATGAYLAFAESGKVTTAQKKIRSAETQLKGLLQTDPAPSVENVTASEQNVEQLQAELLKIRENLQRGSTMNVATDGVRVMASIQQYISDYQRGVDGHQNEDGEATPIETPNDFAFGFDQYIDKASVPDDAAAIPVLDKQRQVLSYILDQLIAANPKAIQQVEREALELKRVVNGKTTGKSGFKINPAISAKVPGAIDTMAFSVTFTGYTDSLRLFLNNLSKFDLPIVVRSVEVKRPTGGATAQRQAPDRLASIFGGGTSAAATQATKEAQKPIISENASSFTVILEFIEIVLPSESEENPA